MEMGSENVEEQTQLIRLFGVKITEGKVGAGSMVPAHPCRKTGFDAEIELERRDVSGLIAHRFIGAGGDGLARGQQTIDSRIRREALAHIQLAEFSRVRGVSERRIDPVEKIDRAAS